MSVGLPDVPAYSGKAESLKFQLQVDWVLTWHFNRKTISTLFHCEILILAQPLLQAGRIPTTVM